MRGVVLESIMGRYEVSKRPALHPVPLLIGVSRVYSRSFIHSQKVGKNKQITLVSYEKSVLLMRAPACLFPTRCIWLLYSSQNGPNAYFTATKVRALSFWFLTKRNGPHQNAFACFCLTKCRCMSSHVFVWWFVSKLICLFAYLWPRPSVAFLPPPKVFPTKCGAGGGKQLTLLLQLKCANYGGAPMPWSRLNALIKAHHIKSSMAIKLSRKNENSLRNRIALSSEFFFWGYISQILVHWFR